eukprot:TRINITY_DN107596_c0_g1_i1.p1 TRINITY_DN107596_c0_g1~~TRINITY_DN107596_c0_g1_i1.p1  ORF type:complete len:353 (-),score=67.67 TRINITY_DN107596_c0_g1_i1:101-1135(-)
MEKSETTVRDTVMSYDTSWNAYALAWSQKPDARFRLAVGSCIEKDMNHIHVVEQNGESKKLELVGEVQSKFPPTKLMWQPASANGSKSDLLVSSTTTLNLYKYEQGQLLPYVVLQNTRSQKQTSQNLPPITSFDWSTVRPDKLGAASVDTTCTIWNLERQKIETQLIAHDKAVYDIAFSKQESLFASVGADGSVRLFDQRNLEHSTIIYEESPSAPLLRLAWNKSNSNHIATLALDCSGVKIIDIRRPSVAMGSLKHGEGCVNCITWAPHSQNHLLCGMEDGYSVIWDVSEVMPSKTATADKPKNPMAEVVLDCDSEIYQSQWPMSNPDYVALGMARQVRVLQI